MIDIIDVTLRDGGHAVSFDWPKNFAKEYYSVVSEIPSVKLIELGYWGQTYKSTNTFYNLDYDKVCDVTQSAKRKNVSIMIDYHYCSHNLKDYPDATQDEISMIRVCARKRDLDDALKFVADLKQHTGLMVSLNVFNVSNYSHIELFKVCQKLSKSNLDYVYFADTHGSLDLQERANDFKQYVHTLSSSGIRAGMHLHDHAGKAYFNYSNLRQIGFESTDASTRGMGKGVGNLKLEHIIPKEYLPNLLQIVHNNEELLTMRESPYGLLSAVYSVTDYYAYNAEKQNMSLDQFNAFCQSISNQNKDVYNESALLEFLRYKNG